MIIIFITFNASADSLIRFDISKQRADKALISFAQKADQTIIFSFDLTKAYQANELKGFHSVQSGLQKLLKDSGLIAVVNNSGQLSIQVDKHDRGITTMKNKTIKTALLPLILGAASQTALAQEPASGANDTVEKIQIIGSRSLKERSVMNSPVPVDIISADDINAVGGTADMTDNLKALIPSYTATPATGDGSAFVRPTSLRGTSSDQTLVLIDGKRRHRSALVQFFAPAAGNGAHAPDVGMIPSIALKRVEVLRDGAASQYGSDAIAGVINFVTKDASDGGAVELQYGQHYDGESSMKLAANKGLAIGEDGFLNLSLEYVDNEALSRGVIRPDAQALVDAGIEGVGADSPFGDAPFTQSWGRPETSALRMFANAGIELDNNKQLYGRFSYGDTTGRYRFFYRNPGHSTIASLKDDGYTGKLTEVGFTPYLDGDQTDFSAIVGLKGEMFGDTAYDFSVSSGSNELNYFLNNSVNPGLGLSSGGGVYQMDFNTGGYKQEEVNVNADFSAPVGDNFNVAYGLEWREETYTSMAGEVNSYSDISGIPNGGVSGMRGIEAKNAGSFSRDNVAVYVDVEQDVTDELLMQYALRYEDFSDFGSTANWKVAGNYSISDDSSIRAAISTGFHAPTPGQANVSTTITTFDGTTGAQVEEGLIPATSDLAIALGGQELKEETSTNFSIGMSSSLGDNTTVTLDFYKIAVDDRIYRTGNISVDDPRFNSVSFYTNVLDVEHSGLDLVVSSTFDWDNSTSTDVAFSYGYNEIEVVNVREVNGNKPVSDSTIEDIENNFPNHRFVLTTNTNFGDDWNLMVRANFYGSHYDERGEIGAETNPSAEIDSIIYLDAELGYQVNDALRVKLGFSNIFDNYIDEIDAPYANRQSVGLQYPRRSAANYEGGSWYLGLSYGF